MSSPKTVVSSPPAIRLSLGLDEIRARIMQRCKSLLDANNALTGFCNDPRSIVHIEMSLEDEKQCFTRQYPIPLSLVPLADEVITTWRNKPITEPALPGTLVNNPILVAPKKNAENLWLAIRVCLDLRNVNKRLKNDDYYQIPRISEILTLKVGRPRYGLDIS